MMGDFTLSTLVQSFRKHIEEGNFECDDDRVTSVLDFLYVAYTESKGNDPKEINQGFVDLENYMEGVSLADNDAIFALVCTLCDLYEKRAFQEGIQLGAYLMAELFESK